MDLNRNFPDPFNPNDVETQPETLAIMGVLEEYVFLVGANMHGGEVVVNFPHDSYEGGECCDKMMLAGMDRMVGLLSMGQVQVR